MAQSKHPFLDNSNQGPEESDLYTCVHCGFCLQACPTYLETGLETESPRGRIALMKAVHEERIPITPNVIRHWDMCIQCRACEIACPSGVPYGRLIEATMVQVQPHRNQKIVNRFIYNLSLKKILINQGILTVLFSCLKFYQKSGIQKIVRWLRILKMLPGNVSELEASLPQIPNKFFNASDGVQKAQLNTRAKVSLLTGCVMPLVHGPQMEGVVRVLNKNGCDVVTPIAQSCCGAISSHVGDLETARNLARTNIEAFMSQDVDAIVVASAGCGIRMKEYGHLLKDDPDYSSRAIDMSKKVKDIHEFLVDLPIVVPTGNLKSVVTYQDSCHLANTQSITSQPRQLLDSIPGVNFVELPNSSICCGGGGTYTITERDMSLRVLESKMEAVALTGADTIATANPGCLIQLEYGSKKAGLPIKVKYVTDLLDEAYSSQ